VTAEAGVSSQHDHRNAAQELGFSRIVDALAAACESSPGRALARRVGPVAGGVDAASTALRETSEAGTLLDRGQGVRLADVDDHGALLARAKRGGVLEVEELRAIGRSAAACAEARSHAHDWATIAPRVHARVVDLPDLRLLAEAVSATFDERGNIRDDASPALGRLRVEADTIASQLRGRITRYLSDPSVADLLQDDYFTVRDDRFVLPVRVTEKRSLPGIIHGASQTGQTLYIEPQEMVELNNKLKLAQEAVRREERAILASLTRDVGDESDALTEAAEIVAWLDERFARARLARRLDAHAPIFSEDGSIHLPEMRHPLLVLDDVRVVPNDLFVEAPARWLVVSGPNAGGKTVALTSLGLAAEMARSGLFVPSAEGARLPFFSAVHVVLGDAQDLHEGFSTFSSHVRRVALALNATGATPEEGGISRSPALVLVDEIGVGTEPLAGSALATALLEAFADRDCLGTVTTHYEALKLLPLRDDRFENSAFGLDPKTLAPDFHLVRGQAGSSSPLEIAERMGLARPVLQRARALLGAGDAGVEQVLAKLRSTERALEEERTNLARERRAVEVIRKDIDEARARIKREAAERMAREAADGLAEARSAREVIRRALVEMRSVRKPEEVEAMRRKVTEAEGQLRGVAQHAARHSSMAVAEGRDPLRKAASGADLRIGAQLWYDPMSKTAEVVDVASDKKRAKIRIGVLEMWATLDQLALPRLANPPPTRPAAQPSPPRTAAHSDAAPIDEEDTLALRAPDRSVDLRGARVDEALSAIDRALDQAIVKGAAGICIIHGLGTGALRSAARDHIKRHPQVARSRPGRIGEGGDGVTFVWVQMD